MSKEILQISFQTGPTFKTKFGKWFYKKIWFKFWFIFRPKMLSKLFKGLANFCDLFISKEQKEKLDKELKEELSEIQFVINDKEIENINEYNKLINELEKEIPTILKIPKDKFDNIDKK